MKVIKEAIILVKQKFLPNFDWENHAKAESWLVGYLRSDIQRCNQYREDLTELVVMIVHPTYGPKLTHVLIDEPIRDFAKRFNES